MSRTSGYKVRINTHTADDHAIILLADGVLIGVLSELRDECHGLDRGKWAIESTFVDHDKIPIMFDTATAAANWLGVRMASGLFDLAGQVPELH
jgi:hypothetical protein